MSPSLRGQHPSPEELDALLDQPDAGRRTRLAAHAITCDQCCELLEGMRRVRNLLHEESLRPVPLPPRVQARLEGSIAALSASVATSPNPTSGRPPVPRWLSLAAGLVVLGGTGLAASQLLADGGAGDLAGSAVSASAGPSAQQTGSSGPAAVAPPDRGVTASGTAYTREDLPGDVQALLSTLPNGPLGPLRTGLSPNEAAQDDDTGAVSGAPLADPTALATCLVAVGAPTRQPLVVDIGTWQARPAALVVVPVTAGSSRLLVSVVDPHCRSGTDLLYRTTVDR